MSNVSDSQAAYSEPGNGRNSSAAATHHGASTTAFRNEGARDAFRLSDTNNYASTWQDLRIMLHRHPEWTLLVGLSLGVAVGWLIKRR